MLKEWNGGLDGWIFTFPLIPPLQYCEAGEGRIMALSKEQVIRLVADKIGPSIIIEAKMEKGVWRITLTKEGKASILEFKRGFLEDYFERGEYQQEIAFEARVQKALKGLS
jgi:hypothetical protein